MANQYVVVDYSADEGQSHVYDVQASSAAEAARRVFTSVAVAEVRAELHPKIIERDCPSHLHPIGQSAYEVALGDYKLIVVEVQNGH